MGAFKSVKDFESIKARQDEIFRREKERKRRKTERLRRKSWNIWEDETIVPWKPKYAPKAIPAPKRELPGHSESINPPDEYLLDEKEKEQYDQLEESERPLNFVP